MLTFYIALLTTILAEGTTWIGYSWMSGAEKSADRYRWMLIGILGMNLVSHPLAWMIQSYGGGNFWLVELMVLLIEAVALKWLANVSGGAALILSLMLNGVSLLVGLLLFSF